MGSKEEETISSEGESSDLISLLKEDFIPIERRYSSDDSNLSDWSNTTFDEHDEVKKPVEETEESSIEERIIHLNLTEPKKQTSYTTLNIDSSSASQWLTQNTQHSWWMQQAVGKCEMNSLFENANFCCLWQTHLLETGKSVVPINEISIVSEYCLLREIIWMFHIPVTCKFFKVEGNEITVQDKVSLPSTTLRGIKGALDYFIPYIKMMNNLRNFVAFAHNGSNHIFPKTYEFYATGLYSLLQQIYEKLTKLEEIIMNQSEIYTVIRLVGDLEEDFLFLNDIHQIHESSILDHTKTPAHICSAFLLTNLLNIFELSATTQIANIAISLFLSSIKVFCSIIDTWWTDGRLDDWRNEFVIDKCDGFEEISSRLYSKSREKLFFVALDVSKIIQESVFFKILMDHSLEAGCTLNLLVQIDKIGNLNSETNFKDNLYNSFINDVLSNVSLFGKDVSEICKDGIEAEMENHLKNDTTNDENDFLRSIDDDFLRMAFEINIKKEKVNVVNEEEHSARNIFEKLKVISNLFLPLEEIICKSLSNILQARISFANKFVTDIYHNEFEILKHLQNIRLVLLLEAGDLMYTFYTKLFSQIESGKNWMNPFILTVQLDDILCSRFPEISSLFRIEINADCRSQTKKVMEGVNDLLVTYNLRKELKNIITETNISQYNKIFQFLLKVKWGLWTMENLPFSKLSRNRLPYAELGEIDIILRRLEQLRFWVLYAIQSIHFYLTANVLQTMKYQLDEKIKNCKNLSEMKSTHDSYINTVCKYCLIDESSSSDLRMQIEQLLNLVNVIKIEWTILERLQKKHPISIFFDDDDELYKLSSDINEIEKAYIGLHKCLAKSLNNAVFLKQQSYLTGLSAAFNTSLPC